MKKDEDPLLTLQALAISAIKRGLDRTADLKKPGLLPSWHLDLWQNLISEFGLEYKELMAFYEANNIRASAWTARNILELSIWGAYCAQSPGNAKRFYDDKVRDTFDFLEHTKALVSLLDKSELSVSELIDESRSRILKKAQTEDYEDTDETFQRVYDAAKTIGQHEIFRSLNKMLSKFAHPTAMMVFSLPDEPTARQFGTFFFMVGTVFSVSAMTEFEEYVKSISGTTSG